MTAPLTASSPFTESHISTTTTSSLVSSISPPLTRGSNKDDNKSTVWHLQEELRALEPLRKSLPITVRLVETRLATLAASLLAKTASTNKGTDATSGEVKAGGNTLIGTGKRFERINIPTDTGYNFVGRILGPGGKTLRSISENTRCKIAIRGKGSVRPDKMKQYRDTPGFEHLTNDVLHVYIEPAKGVAEWEIDHVLENAKKTVSLYLVPVPEEIDILKKQQLSDLAKMRGTYSDKYSTVIKPEGNLSLSLDENNDKLTLEDLAIASSPTLGIHSQSTAPSRNMQFHTQLPSYGDTNLSGPDALSPVSVSPTPPVTYAHYAGTPPSGHNYFVGNDPQALSYDSNVSYDPVVSFGDPVSPAVGFNLMNQQDHSYSAQMIPSIGSRRKGSIISPLDSSDLSPEPQGVFRRAKSAHSVPFERNAQTADTFDRTIGSSTSKRR